MTPTVGIFVERATAERAVANLRAIGVSPENIRVLVPGTSDAVVSKVPTSEAEQPGIGKAMGVVIGGAVGAAGGGGPGGRARAAAALTAPRPGPSDRRG